MEQSNQQRLFGVPVVTTRHLAGEATYLKLADGRELVLKGVPRQERSRWRPGTPWAELVALDAIGALGGPVPRLVALDLEAGWLLRTYEPGRPLSQEIPTGEKDPGLFSSLVAALFHLERLFVEAQDAIKAHTTAAAPSLWGTLHTRMQGLLSAQAQEAWAELSREVLTPDALTVGPLDINAGNALWQRSRIIFLDFATIGPDFPERRLASYAQIAWPKVGSSLDANAFSRYRAEYGNQAALRLALFDLLYWAIALSRLRVVLDHPESAAARALAGEVPEPERLWQPTLDMWTRRRLSDERINTIVRGIQFVAKPRDK